MVSTTSRQQTDLHVAGLFLVATYLATTSTCAPPQKRLMKWSRASVNQFSRQSEGLKAHQSIRMTRCTMFLLFLTCWIARVSTVQAARESEVRRALSELAASATPKDSVGVQDLLEGPPELTTALPLFNQLVREERREVLHLVGELHLLGDGTVPHNATHAELFLQASATYGSSRAQFLLGALKASSGDSAGAHLNYQFATHGSSISASMALGYRALYGYGSPKSCSTAMRHYKFAADRVVTEQDDLRFQHYAFPDPIRLSDSEGAQYRIDINPAEDIHRAEYLRQRAADLSNANVLVQSASITLFSDLYADVDDESAFEEHASREREALRFLERSIEMGSIKAQALLGHVYAYGLAGCKPNVTRAAELYESALNASQGSPSGEAANGLGVIYSRGIGGVSLDGERAHNLFMLAASAGHAEGVYNTGMGFLAMGSHYMPRAKEYFVAAAHVGHLKSLFQLARLKQRQVYHSSTFGGVNSGVTCEEVVELYKRVAEHSREGTGLMTVALSHTQRGNWPLALEMYLIASETGYEIAQSNAIWLIERIKRQVFGTRSDRDATRLDRLYDQLVGRAAAQNSVDALLFMGDAAFQDENYAIAMRHYQRADLVSAGNSARALYSVGYMYEHGLGVSLISTDRAGLYYHLAGVKEPPVYHVMELLRFKLRVQKLIKTVVDMLGQAWLAIAQYSDEVGSSMEVASSSMATRDVEESSTATRELNNQPMKIDQQIKISPGEYEDTAVDDSSEGVALNSISRSAPVEYAAALQFLGDQSRLHLEFARGDLPLEHQDFTIETWLVISEAPSAGSNAQQVVTLVDALDNFQLELLQKTEVNGDACWILRFRKYSLVDEQLPELVISFPNAPLIPHSWNHVAVTFDAKYQTVSLVLNAKVKQVLSFRPHPASLSRTASAGSDASSDSSSRLLAVGSDLARIYGTAVHNCGVFSGQLVHFRLWKTRKTAKEISVLMMEQYDEVESRDLLIHLRYKFHGTSTSNKINGDRGDTGSKVSPILNGDRTISDAHGLQLKIVEFPPPQDN